MADIDDFFEPHWPEGLETGVEYEFQCDDKCDADREVAHLRLLISNDGDVFVSMAEWHDIENSDPSPFPSVRCRTSVGGGRHLRTRQALLLLAQAIRLDNEELRGDQSGQNY